MADEIPPVEELMANTEAMLYRDLIATALAGHSEILQKRMFTCTCGEFSVALSAAGIRELFLKHRADAVMAVLKNAGVEL